MKTVGNHVRQVVILLPEKEGFHVKYRAFSLLYVFTIVHRNSAKGPSPIISSGRIHFINDFVKYTNKHDI